MKNLKRILAIILCASLVFSTLSISAYANDNPRGEYGSGDTDYPIIFVTGIGQSQTYYYENEEDMAKDIAENTNERATSNWNLFNDFKPAFSKFTTYVNLFPVVFGILGSLTGVNLVPRICADGLVKSLFALNICDENGNLPKGVYTPRYNCSVADYTQAQKDRFYHTIPCREVTQNVSEEMLYCFNYSAFGFTYNHSKDLNTFINEVVLPQSGKDKVVLVPMSMGASVVSAYLQDYGTQGKVARVVSIVGAWYGSDVIADLVELKYADNAPELLYNGIVADLVGEPGGYIVNMVLRLFPKATLRSIIDELLDSIVENLLLRTPTLLALIPPERYAQIRKDRLEGREELAYVMAQTDKYYEAQVNLKNTFENLNNNYGVNFFFVAGYGFEYGGYSSDYEFFKFLKSSSTTNSDEIIHISATAPGATYVPFDKQFDADYLASHDANYISPNKSVDISTCYFKDRVWLFEHQKHELEYNNNAIQLALDLAIGKVDNSNDCEYPRFNGSRDIKRLKRNYMNDLDNWLLTNEVTAEQQTLIDNTTAEVNTMINSRINNREEDDKVIKKYYDMLVTLGVYEAPAEEKDDFSTKTLRKINDKVYKVFGAKGFIDILKFWEK